MVAFSYDAFRGQWRFMWCGVMRNLLTREDGFVHSAERTLSAE